MTDLTRQSPKALKKAIYTDDYHRLHLEDKVSLSWQFEKYVLVDVAPFFMWTREQAEELRIYFNNEIEEQERIID